MYLLKIDFPYLRLLTYALLNIQNPKTMPPNGRNPGRFAAEINVDQRLILIVAPSQGKNHPPQSPCRDHIPTRRSSAQLPHSPP
jgi:hypothetical protein